MFLAPFPEVAAKDIAEIGGDAVVLIHFVIVAEVDGFCLSGCAAASSVR